MHPLERAVIFVEMDPSLLPTKRHTGPLLSAVMIISAEPAAGSKESSNSHLQMKVI